MRVSGLSPTRAGPCGRARRYGVACLASALILGGLGTSDLFAQQWRSRVSTRVQYVEGMTLVRDSVPIAETSGSGTQRTAGEIPVTCSTGAAHCYFYRSGRVANSAPAVLDVDFNIFGFGIEGLRGYVSTRFRTDFGDDEFWPRVNDNFDLLAGYLELNRRSFRVRVGRDYQVSGLGFYGYDGGSVVYRIATWSTNLEAFGGWGLERGVPEPVNSSEFGSLGIYQPQERNYLYGLRGSARPTPNSSVEAIYQREIPTDGAGITSERLGFEATYHPTPDVSLLGHADYDMAAKWWGKAGLTASWTVIPALYLEGRLFRYRPVFSLQTIWLAFSPVPYTGWGLATGVYPIRNLSVKIEVERRQYGDTEAEVPFLNTTDRDWRVGGYFAWRPGEWMGIPWDIDGGYWRNWGFGAALNSGNLRVGIRPHDQLSLGLRLSAFQQLEEFRIDEGRVWGAGADVRWRTRSGTVWFSFDNYEHDRRDNAALSDWSQQRAALGFSYYVGSEPGRAP